MTVRVPVRRTPSGDIRDMTQTEIDALIVRSAYVYAATPSIFLQMDQLNEGNDITGTNIEPINHTHNFNPADSGFILGPPSSYQFDGNQYFRDKYWLSGLGVTHTTGFLPESVTPEPFEVFDDRMRLRVETPSIGFPTDTTGYRYPLYRNASNHLQPMTGTDLQDTLIIPALEYIAGKSSIAGAPAPEDMPGIGYKIVTTTGTEADNPATLPSSPTASGHIYASGTKYSSGPTGYQVHTDTIPDQTRLTNGTGAGLIEDNQRVELEEFTSYWLMRKPTEPLTSAPGFADGGNAKPLMYDGSGHLREMTLAYDVAIPQTMIFDMMMQIPMKWYATNGGVGKRLRYEIADASTTTYEILGSIMLDRHLIFDSVGARGTVYQRFVNDDDYRSAEFPVGTPSTVSQYALIVRHDY